MSRDKAKPGQVWKAPTGLVYVTGGEDEKGLVEVTCGTRTVELPSERLWMCSVAECTLEGFLAVYGGARADLQGYAWTSRPQKAKVTAGLNPNLAKMSAELDAVWKEHVRVFGPSLDPGDMAMYMDGLYKSARPKPEGSESSLRYGINQLGEERRLAKRMCRDVLQDMKLLKEEVVHLEPEHSPTEHLTHMEYNCGIERENEELARQELTARARRMLATRREWPRCKCGRDMAIDVEYVGVSLAIVGLVCSEVTGTPIARPINPRCQPHTTYDRISYALSPNTQSPERIRKSHSRCRPHGHSRTSRA